MLDNKMDYLLAYIFILLSGTLYLIFLIIKALNSNEILN